MAEPKIPDDIANVKPKAEKKVEALPPPDVRLSSPQTTFSIINDPEKEEEVKVEKKAPNVLYYDIQHALNSQDYLIFIAFDSTVSAVSVRIKEEGAPTLCLEQLGINYICVSRQLQKSKLKFLLHFENKADKYLNQGYTLDDSEMKLFVIQGKMGYYYLNYNAKMQLSSVNKLIGNYEKEGLHKLLKIGLKISFVKLTSEYKKFLAEIQDAVTDGWFISKDTDVKVLGTALLGLFANQGLHFDLFQFQKPLYGFFCALQVKEILDTLQPFTKLQVDAFWQGMIALSNKIRGKAALQILKFSEIVSLESLQFDRLEGTDATLEQSFKYVSDFKVHQNVKDALFVEHVELKDLRDQYLEDMLRLFDPSQNAIKRLKRYVKQEVEKMSFNLKYSSKIQVRKIEDLKTYIPLGERQRTRDTREVLFYISFPEFKVKTDEEVYLVIYGQKWPMQKIPNSKVYFILIELNNNIYNLAYHYQWKKEKTARIDRYYVAQMQTIFDTPEFIGKIKSKLDKTKLFLQYLKLYCLRPRELPSEFVREMDAFMTKYFIKFEEKAAIEIIEKFATEMD